jgi:hypothetical protein
VDFLTTLRAASATTGRLTNEASGGSTSTIGVRSDGWLTSLPRTIDSAIDSTTSLQPATAHAERTMAAIIEAAGRIRIIARR